MGLYFDSFHGMELKEVQFVVEKNCLSLLKPEGGPRGSVSKTCEFATASAYDSVTAAFFMALSEQMGVALQRKRLSVNIKSQSLRAQSRTSDFPE